MLLHERNPSACRVFRAALSGLTNPLDCVHEMLLALWFAQQCVCDHVVHSPSKRVRRLLAAGGEVPQEFLPEAVGLVGDVPPKAGNVNPKIIIRARSQLQLFFPVVPIVTLYCCVPSAFRARVVLRSVCGIVRVARPAVSVVIDNTYPCRYAFVFEYYPRFVLESPCVPPNFAL